MITYHAAQTPHTICAAHLIEWILEDTTLDSNVATLLLYPMDAYCDHSGGSNELNPERIVRYTYRFDDERNNFAQSITATCAQVDAYGVLSQVEVGDREPITYKLPFVDLAIPADESIGAYIQAAIAELPAPFEQLYLVLSGHSFHLYGDRLVRAREWNHFLDTALTWQYVDSEGNTQYLADIPWLGHARAQGIGTIRIAPRLATETQDARPQPMLFATLKDA